MLGAVRVAGFVGESFADYPVATATALGLFTLYAVPFLIFVAALDYLEREPPLLMATAFLWGGLVATSISIRGTGALYNLLAKLVSPAFAATWGPALAGPTVEEVAKVLGVVAIVLIARAQVNSVLDGVVYGALVGLGFQVVENVAYAVNAVAMAGRGDQVGPVMATFLLRGFLAGLWSHTLFTALAGAGIGYLVVRTDRSALERVGVAAAAFAGAWACHLLWNSPLLGDGFGAGGLGLFAGLLVKGLPPLLMILLLVRAVRHHEADYYTAQLAALGDSRVATHGRVAGSGPGPPAGRRPPVRPRAAPGAGDGRRYGGCSAPSPAWPSSSAAARPATRGGTRRSSSGPGWWPSATPRAWRAWAGTAPPADRPRARLRRARPDDRLGRDPGDRRRVAIVALGGEFGDRSTPQDPAGRRGARRSAAAGRGASGSAGRSCTPP